MKYIVVGLGIFGGALAEKLALHGNEVIGIDLNMSRVELFKEKLSHTICMDATDEASVAGLPLKDTDVVIVAIGVNQGPNILATTIFQNLNVNRVISRASDSIHVKVLRAVGVKEIVDPEVETAERWAKKLCLNNVVESFELTHDFGIIEATAKPEYEGKSVREIGLHDAYGILVLTIIREGESRSLLSKSKKDKTTQGVVRADSIIKADDILVLYGTNQDLQKYLKQN